MGFETQSLDMTIKKETTALLLLPEQSAPSPSPCIRCGRCSEVCPMHLLPQQLYFFSQQGISEKLTDYHLFNCIECGLCNYSCPSNIPLVQQFQFSKGELLAKRQKKTFSEHSKMRYEMRLERLERNKLRRAQQLEEKRKKLAEKPKQSSQQSDLIAEALARVAAKKKQKEQSE